jgi:SAM-dependent methyltransferase
MGSMAHIVHPRPVAEIRSLIRERSTLPADETEAVIAKRFAAPPRRLELALRRWPLREVRVLDVGCSYGHCLLHFGPGSTGIDVNPEHVDFCRSLGLDARLVDVDEGLDGIPDAGFDYLWASDVVEHLDAPRLLLRRLRPKLAPGGRLIVFLTVLPRSRLARWALRRRHANPFDSGAHHYQFSYETARYLVERAGYRIEGAFAPPLPARLVAQAPRLFLEARVDEAAGELVTAAERKNKAAAVGT